MTSKPSDIPLINHLKNNWGRDLVGLYLILLIVSHAVRARQPVFPEPDSGYKAVQVQMVDQNQRLPKMAQIAYLDLYPEDRPNAPTILLINGSPPVRGVLSPLASALSNNYRVLMPDMPGFNDSTNDIPDYSIQAHADYFLQLLDKLQIKECHVVGYSQGGGVVLHLTHMAPERITSVTMLSAIGVVELELLGDYHLNHALHGLQLAVIWLVLEGTPHFGYLDNIFLNEAYARNFYDSDQRPLRDHLKNYKGPMLILHGTNDRLVPVEAAREHHRIVPQSTLVTYDSGHMMIYSDAKMAASVINTFIYNVEHGQVPYRSDANSSRITAAERPFDSEDGLKADGIGLVVLMLLLAFATFVSEDLTCIGAGMLVARGTMGYLPATVACFVGIFVGDMLLYLAGKYLGQSAVRKRPLKWFIKEADLNRSARWFRDKGPVIIILTRFLPGTRLPTYFVAGVLETGLLRFALYFSIAAAAWTPLLVGLSMVLGQIAFEYFAVYQKFALPGVIAVIAVLWLILRIGRPMLSHKGRRRLLSTWYRLTRWEFWPPYIFYGPIFIYVLYLGVRFRSLTLFTAANPAIPEGGFIGESKTQILDLFPDSQPEIARYRLISQHLSGPDKIRTVEQFMTEHELCFPIVLKPDQGQRGSGIGIIRSAAEVTSYFQAAPGDVIAQEYVSGKEYGVFYYRYPGEANGKILSMTDKRFPTVTGDGSRTLEALILDDARAVCMAPLYLDLHQERLDDILPEGESIQLVDIGTHCRGAVFVDGSAIETPALAAAIDQLSRSAEGFYFGRYDIRTPSIADFQQGENFKVVELNGVTSEATHIYDPKNSLWQAYRVLMRQWRIAFEIGAANRRRGVEPAGAEQLIRLLYLYL